MDRRHQVEADMSEKPEDVQATEAEDLDVVAHSDEEEENPGCIINHSNELQ